MRTKLKCDISRTVGLYLRMFNLFSDFSSLLGCLLLFTVFMAQLVFYPYDTLNYASKTSFRVVHVRDFFEHLIGCAAAYVA